MLKERRVVTEYPIDTCMISYDSTRAIIVAKKGEREYYIQMFDLESYEKTFEEIVGGTGSDYIKIKDIEQNDAGNKYACVYLNDGKFKLRTFEKSQRTEDEITNNELDINGLLDIDDWTMAIDGFSDPYIVCCFISDTLLFVALYHNYSGKHYHFIWDVEAKAMKGPSVEVEMNSNKKNFPYKSFYNEDLKEVYLFYRQGQSMIINPEYPKEYLMDRMTEMDLG
jgi:hypothetical protein